jgi:hypothetical protein
VDDNRRLNIVGANNTGDHPFFTTLKHEDVPRIVAQQIDDAMDDGVRYTGAVQWGGAAWPHNHIDSGGPPDDSNFLEIIIARQ